MDISGRDMEGVLSSLRTMVGQGDIARITFTGSGPMDGVLRTHPDDNADYISRALGCTVCGMDVRTSLEIDMDSRAGGSDMTAKVITEGRSLESDRDAVLSIIRSNPIAARHMERFESMSNDALRDLVQRATGLLVARLEGSR